MNELLAGTVATQAKVLVVDDRPENIFALKQILETLDSEIYTAQSGNEALALMLHNDFAVAFLDVQMPVLNGIETLKQIKQHDPDLSIIMVSASVDIEHVRGALKEGAYGLGASRFETSIKVMVPAALSGIVAAFLLAVARAVGETMVVALAAAAPTLPVVCWL